MSNSPTKDKRIVRTEKALRDALIQLMETKDFRAITIKEIIGLADYNRGTFYAHYPHKDALLEAMVKDLIEGFIQAYREPYLDKSELNIDELSVSGIKIFGYIEQNAKVFRLLLNSEYIPHFQDRLADAMRNVIEKDFVPPSGAGVNHELYVYHQTYAIFGLIQFWVKSDFAYTAQYMTNQLLILINLQRLSIKVTPNK
ncbi:TetR/AcrR family transcriptional regulator [Cohnella suwonensis]|uniref:TetR/AcrR family transcriptional regulator n=1 Tax=Cohnella suwonensis TaxID=696072 RepID=A0ABW0LTA3_9BACL